MEDDFDQVQRAMYAVGRAAAVFIPVWIVLLIALPFTGLGALACLSAATLLSAGAVAWSERRRGRRLADERRPAGEAGAPAPRRPMSAMGGAGLALGGVVLLIYVILVLRAA